MKKIAVIYPCYTYWNTVLQAQSPTEAGWDPALHEVMPGWMIRERARALHENGQCPPFVCTRARFDEA